MKTLGIHLAILILVLLPINANSESGIALRRVDPLQELGRRLFFDVDLSANRTQSCSSCHVPEYGFADPRGMTSPGDDGVSVGFRNAPTASYAALAPRFERSAQGYWVGGLTMDGRESTLEEQAGGPFLNPIEMGMPNKASVVARLREKPYYRNAFKILFGTSALDDVTTAYTSMTKAIAAFERTELFSPFSSKFDRFLRGEAKLTKQEEHGRQLFFSKRAANCHQCHLVTTSQGDPRETFTNYRYYNIGTPNNLPLRKVIQVPDDAVDPGLAGNRMVDGDPAQFGKFRTPTLRNVAITAPYMHNGVFRELRTVILFHNRYNAKQSARVVNPETGRVFGPPPVPETLSLKELQQGSNLTGLQIDALVAFLHTLSDARYESTTKSKQKH